LSCSEQVGLALLATPALASCSSSDGSGHFQLAGELTYARLCHVGSLLEPVRARRHDQILGPLVVDAGHFHQLVDRQVGQVVAGADARAFASLAASGLSMPSRLSRSSATFSSCSSS
jgi:hypothetical protein